MARPCRPTPMMPTLTGAPIRSGSAETSSGRMEIPARAPAVWARKERRSDGVMVWTFCPRGRSAIYPNLSQLAPPLRVGPQCVGGGLVQVPEHDVAWVTSGSRGGVRTRWRLSAVARITGPGSASSRRRTSRIWSRASGGRGWTPFDRRAGVICNSIGRWLCSGSWRDLDHLQVEIKVPGQGDHGSYPDASRVGRLERCLPGRIENSPVSEDEAGPRQGPQRVRVRGRRGPQGGQCRWPVVSAPTQGQDGGQTDGLPGANSGRRYRHSSAVGSRCARARVALKRMMIGDATSRCLHHIRPSGG